MPARPPPLRARGAPRPPLLGDARGVAAFLRPRRGRGGRQFRRPRRSQTTLRGAAAAGAGCERGGAVPSRGVVALPGRRVCLLIEALLRLALARRSRCGPNDWNRGNAAGPGCRRRESCDSRGVARREAGPGGERARPGGRCGAPEEEMERVRPNKEQSPGCWLSQQAPVAA